MRNNFQADQYSEFLANYGYNIITRSDLLKQQPIFSLVYSLFKFCMHPWNNENVVEFAQIVKKQKLLKLSNSDIDYLKNLKSPFILTNQDSIDSEVLTQLLWDLNYWLGESEKYFIDGIDEFAIKIGSYYYLSEI